MEIKPIAHMKSDFKTKFGIPRQAGLVPELKSVIVFEEQYRNSDALRGLEGYDRIWVIWGFSENPGFRDASKSKSDQSIITESNLSQSSWAPTVRPPRLGGNTRVGVFASRSPNRPNSLGMSCVEIENIDTKSSDGPYIYVKGADLMDGTPIYDIKPYIPYSDSFPDARAGFAKSYDPSLEVILPKPTAFPQEKLAALIKVLELDPRPAYQDDPDRIYGFIFAGYEIKFMVNDNKLFVKEIVKNED